LPERILLEDLDFVLNEIRIVSKSGYEDKIEEARKILKYHWKDFPYLALSLKFNCKIFSGDKRLKKIIPERVITPKELLDEFL